MDSSAARFTSMASVVHTIRGYLEQYNIPDRDYLSVNICKRCELDILDCAPYPTYTGVAYGLNTFFGMTVNNVIPPRFCIICKGRNNG